MRAAGRKRKHCSARCRMTPSASWRENGKRRQTVRLKRQAVSRLTVYTSKNSGLKCCIGGVTIGFSYRFAPRERRSAKRKGSAVPRYFFHVRNHIDAEDFTGAELRDLEAARSEAQKYIADIIKSRSDAAGNNWPSWSIEICNEDQNVLLVVPLSRN